MIAPPLERPGAAFAGDRVLTLLGSPLRVGDPAPPFALDRLDPRAAAPVEVSSAASAGRICILHIVNTVDSPICHSDSCRWDALWRGLLPSTAELYNVSMDLPQTLARWRRMEGIGYPALSAHRSDRFGVDYGVLLKEWRLLQRAVVVIGTDGRIIHAQYVADQERAVDCNAALRAIRHAADPSSG